MVKLRSSDIPQKEDLDLVLKLPGMLESRINTSKLIAYEIDQGPRQANFLLHAGRLLGIAQRSGSGHVLSKKGRLLLGMNENEARHYLRACIVDTRVVIHLIGAAKKGEFSVLDKRDIAKIFRNDAGLSPSTARRRASTMCAWFKWLSQFDSIRMLGSDKFEII